MAACIYKRAEIDNEKEMSVLMLEHERDLEVMEAEYRSYAEAELESDAEEIERKRNPLLSHLNDKATHQLSSSSGIINVFAG